MTNYVIAFLAGAGALAIFLSSTTAVASAAETELDHTFTSTKFFIPNGGPLQDSDCPTAQDGYGTARWKPCHFRLFVRGWSPKAQSFFTVFREEGEQEEARPEMPWEGCETSDRPLFWAVEMWTEDGSWLRQERGSFEIFLNDCGSPGPAFRTLGITREQARKAVLDQLAAFYVSRLRCDRRGKHQICKVTFNNSFSECRTVYRASRFRNNITDSNVTTVTALRRRCTSF